MSAFSLRLVALICMFCDHLGRTAFPDQVWLTYIGRLAFPIFAFQLAVGFQHTHNKRKYALRLLLFAVLSEIPFDLMAYGTPFYWGHQNVMWTLFVSFVCMYILEQIKRKYGSSIITLLLSTATSLLFFIGATLLGFDYAGLGVLQILVFYLFKTNSRYFPLAILSTHFINIADLGGPYISVFELQIPSQYIAFFALIPIFLYNGKTGYRSKKWSWFCYAFYPLHALILSLFRFI